MTGRSDISVQPIVLNAEAIADQPAECFARHECGNGLTFKTLISASSTKTNTFASGIAVCAPKGGMSLHRHRQPELYHFTHGTGLVHINGLSHTVRPGSVVFIPGDAEHGVENPSQIEELKWLYVFATDDFHDIQYRWRMDEESKEERPAVKSKL